jgi:hypothetical protein
MPEIDLATKDDGQIDLLASRYETRGLTNDPFYKQILEERSKRQSNRLKIDVSLQHLIETARAEGFTTYGDIARANDVPWTQARPYMRGPHNHLDRLLDICHVRGYPLLTSICVNQEGQATGELGEDALRGFIAGARRLGRPITDEKEFLRDCQRECFEWAKTQLPQSTETLPRVR